MNILQSAKKNKGTTIIAIITAVSNVWNLVTENAELFGIGSKTIAIGSLVLTAALMVYNQFNND